MSRWRRRSLAELAFRLRQETMNLWLVAMPPRPRLTAPSPLPGLPAAPAAVLRGTPYAARLAELAAGIEAGRLPLLGTSLELGPSIAWRRDPMYGHELPAHYFRRIPYLDFSRAGDHKFLWELNRHQHLVVLAQAWVLDPRPELVRAITDQLDSWWVANPMHKGMNWTSALEVAFRAWSWIWIWHLCGHALPKVTAEALLTSLYQHGRHLEYNLSVYFSPNTHVLGEAVVLHALGVLFPEWPEASRWRRTGGGEVERQARRQVLSDGAHFELSSYYHVYALDMLLLYALLEYGNAGPMAEMLERMADYLHAITAPDRTLALIGDDDGGRFFHPYGERRRFGRATLATASLMLGRNRWPFDAEDTAEQAAWWLGANVLGRSETGQPVGPKPFRESGVIRLGDGVTTHILFDAGGFGPFRAGHSHSDALQLIVWANGEEVLIDPGTFTYIADPAERDRFRGSASHNTLRINNLDQADAAGPFAWNGRPEVWIEEASETDAAAVCVARGFTHRRRVALSGPWLLVSDRLEGPPGEHLVEQFWHLGRAGQTERIRVPEGESLENIDGWRSEALGSRKPATILWRSRRSVLPLEWQTAIALNDEANRSFPGAAFAAVRR